MEPTEHKVSKFTEFLSKFTDKFEIVKVTKDKLTILNTQNNTLVTIDKFEFWEDINHIPELDALRAMDNHQELDQIDGTQNASSADSNYSFIKNLNEKDSKSEGIEDNSIRPNLNFQGKLK